MAHRDYYSLGETLAQSVLRLRGIAAKDFATQFASLAARPVAVHIEGDGEVFKQALCFPVSGTAKGADAVATPSAVANATPSADVIHTIPNVIPYAAIELVSGHVVCLRLLDCTSGKFSLSTFLGVIGKFLDRIHQETSHYWPETQKRIQVVTRRRVEFVDYVLDTNEAELWKTYYPSGNSKGMDSALFNGMPPIAELLRKKTISALAEIQSDHYRQAVDQFIQNLDVSVIKAIRSSGKSPYVSRYNTYHRCDSTATSYRVQASNVVPLLGYLFGEETHIAIRLRRLVDDGAPLWPALADTVGVPEETARWLRGKTADDVSEVWLGRIPELMQGLACVNPEKRPKTRDEWTAYTDFALVLNDKQAMPYRDPWIMDLGRIGWTQALGKFAAMDASPSDLLDVGDLVKEIVSIVGYELLPHVDRYARENNTEWKKLKSCLETLFLETSILKQLRASLRWHELQLRPYVENEIIEADEVNNAVDDPTRLDRWPTPLSTMNLGNLTAHFLATTAQLRDEGCRMEHCVGGYTSSCLFNGANIVSLRTKDGRSVSTAELQLVDYGSRLGFMLSQHKAHKNRSPSAEAEQAMTQLITHLNTTDGMQQRLLEMKDQLKERQKLDDRKPKWVINAGPIPHRIDCVKGALRLHAGYERFLAAGRQALEE